MTGPEHYRKAELWLALADRDDEESEYVMAARAAAQVHATLALAAATVHSSEGGLDGSRRWAEVVW
jgi:hypothetical protein